jgi:hypothetical protein
MRHDAGLGVFRQVVDLLGQEGGADAWSQYILAQP